VSQGYVANILRKAAESEARFECRAALSASIEDARTRLVVEGSELRRAVEHSRREADAALAAHRAALQRRWDAESALGWLAHFLRTETDRAQDGLLATCEPSIRAALKTLDAARRVFLSQEWSFARDGAGVARPPSTMQKLLRRAGLATSTVTRGEFLLVLDQAVRDTRELAFSAEPPRDLTSRLHRAMHAIPEELLTAAHAGANTVDTYARSAEVDDETPVAWSKETNSKRGGPMGSGKAMLEQIIETSVGKRMFQQVEQEARAAEQAIELRRAWFARIADAKRRKDEELPRLREEVAAAERAEQLAKDALRKAQSCLIEVSGREFDLSHGVRDTIERAERQLRLTCDRRILETIEVLEEARREWPSTTYPKLLRFVDADLIGLTRTKKRKGSNRAAVEALRQALEQAIKDAHALALLPEVPEDLDEQLARLRTAAGPHEPPEIVWRDPQPPKYGSDGERLL
jgi:hypothetical protein